MITVGWSLNFSTVFPNALKVSDSILFSISTWGLDLGVKWVAPKRPYASRLHLIQMPSQQGPAHSGAAGHASQ